MRSLYLLTLPLSLHCAAASAQHAFCGTAALPALDDDLKGEAFFRVASHPEIRFTTTAYEPPTPTAGRLTGDLSVKAVTRRVPRIDSAHLRADFRERAKPCA